MVNIYYGKGEYAISDSNLDRLIKAVDDFNTNGIWKWCLVDCLGIKKDGQFGVRYENIIKSLGNVENEKVVKLVEKMLSVEKGKLNISHPTARGTAAKKEKSIRPELASKLLENFTAEEIAELIA